MNKIVEFSDEQFIVYLDGEMDYILVDDICVVFEEDVELWVCFDCFFVDKMVLVIVFNQLLDVFF